MKKPPQFIISRTYSETTPESAENGDFSDSGFIDERARCDFRELIDLMRQHPEASAGHGAGPLVWYSTGYSVDDYSTGTEREECIHWHRENLPRYAKYWTKARRFADAPRRPYDPDKDNR